MPVKSAWAVAVAMAASGVFADIPSVAAPLLGSHVASAGDFNGDGLADALIAASWGGRNFEGLTYIVFGSPGLGSVTREINLLEPGPWGISFEGEFPYDQSGSTIAGLGDVNGDGYADIGIGGPDFWNTARAMRRPLPGRGARRSDMRTATARPPAIP